MPKTHRELILDKLLELSSVKITLVALHIFKFVFDI